MAARTPIGHGPLQRMLRRFHLLPTDRGSTPLAVSALTAMTWVPLALLGAAETWLFGRAEPLLRDLSAHARCLVAVPLFLLAEQVFVRRGAIALERLVADVVIPEDRRDACEQLIGWWARWRDSALVEGLLAAAALARGVTMAAGREDLSITQAWYALIALPVFGFLLGRALWHWLTWALLLLRLTRQGVRPVLAHPDGAGGLAPLTEPTPAFALFTAGVSAVIAAGWANRMLYEGAHLQEFAPGFTLLVVLAELLALGPLLPLSGPLVRARLEQGRQYSRLALRHARLFHRRWIEGHDGGDDKLLDAPDMSTLQDLGTRFEAMTQVRLVPFGPRSVIIVFLAAALPVLPLVALEVPISELMVRFGRAVLGGLPGA